eukprot:1161776-Pelagomonas_calceolata.AAC.8
MEGAAERDFPPLPSSWAQQFRNPTVPANFATTSKPPLSSRPPSPPFPHTNKPAWHARCPPSWHPSSP